MLEKWGGVKTRFYGWTSSAYFVWRKVDFNPKTCKFNGRCHANISKESRVSIGNGFIVNSGVYSGIDCGMASKIVVARGATLIIGENSGITNTVIQCREKIEIGNNVNIGAGCLVMDSNFHSTRWEDRVDRKQDVEHAKTAAIKIGDVVFVGARSIICKGVKIGEHSMIAAGSVVVTDVPPGELWGGNPARFIKQL